MTTLTKAKEVKIYFFQKLWRTLFLICAGLLFALTLSTLFDTSLVEGLKDKINKPMQILYAEIIGFISPGPRYILYPILMKLKEFGVGTGVIITLISGHVLIEPSTGFVESGFFGYRFPLKRFIVSFIITFFAGILTIVLID